MLTQSKFNRTRTNKNRTRAFEVIEVINECRVLVGFIPEPLDSWDYSHPDAGEVLVNTRHLFSRNRAYFELQGKHAGKDTRAVLHPAHLMEIKHICREAIKLDPRYASLALSTALTDPNPDGVGISRASARGAQ